MKEPQITVYLAKYRLAKECEMECEDGNTYKGAFVPYKPNNIPEGTEGKSWFLAKKERNTKKLNSGFTHFLMLPVPKELHDWLVDHGLLSPSDKNWSPLGIGSISVFDSDKTKRK